MRASVLGVSHGGVSVLYSAYDGLQYRPLSRRRRLDGSLVADVPQASPSPRAGTRLAAGPNPLRAGSTLVLRGASLAPGSHVDLFDAAGRRLASAEAGRGGGYADFGPDVTRALPAGLYFARASGGGWARLVVVR